MLKRNRKGMTLVEIMVAVAILSCGLVPIFQALLVSVNAFGASTHYLNLHAWMDEKIWDMKDEVTRGSISTAELGGRVTLANKEFDWSVSTNLIDGDEELYRLCLTVSWKEGGKKKSLTRTAYALPPLKEKETAS